MKHYILLLIAVFSVQFSFSQAWHFVGGSAGYNATEVDLEIGMYGTLYMATIDPDNSNKVTVRRFNTDTQSWQIVGAAGIGMPNAFELQLITTADNKPAFAAKCMRTAGSTTYESFEIYEWNGTAWADRNIFGYAMTEHTYDISLCSNSTGTLFFTFFTNDVQANNGYPVEYPDYEEGFVTVNITSAAQIADVQGTESDYFLTRMSTVAAAGNDVRRAYSYDGLGSGSSYAYVSGSYWDNTGITEAVQIKIGRGPGSSNYSIMGRTNTTGNKLYYKAFNGATPGTEVLIPTSSAATDFDFDTYNDDAYVFYRSSTTCYFKKITGSMSPVVSNISSGTGLAPANATSLAAEKYYGINVIAYISSGKCYVKESNEVSDIDDHDVITMCESTPVTNWLLYFVDSNYDLSNNTLQCTSTNTAVIPNSAITTFGTYPGNFNVTISTTNDVSSPTIVDLKCVLIEDGIRVDSVLVPVTVNPKPSINFTLPSTVCENAPPVNLANGVTPAGGTWFGTGVQGNYFNPSFNPISTATGVNLLYNKTNAFGCSASQVFNITVVPAPVLNISVINADCNENNGAASLSISEGMSPYTVYWSNGSSQNLVNQLPAGPYYVTVTDGNNCTVNKAVMVGSNGVSLTATTTDVLCNGLATGGINVTVAGGTGTLTYEWSNGATTQDLSNIAAGSYEVVVTDEEGCVASGSYTVAQPAPLIAGDIAINASSCGNDDGAAYLTIQGGTAPYTYAWSDENGPLGSSSDALEDVFAGAYVSEVTDDNGCTFTTNVLISDEDGPLIAIDTVITSSCSDDGEIRVINVTGASLDYEWSNGETTEDLTDLAPGTYILETSNGDGCITMLSAVVGSTPPENVEICLITVDTLNNTNLVVWEKPVTNAIDHFNIYRETSQAGVYQLAGSVDYADESIYTDPVASPSVRSWRYKISAVDDCGTESQLSAHHKTIHLTVNSGLPGNINLIWDSYEGFVYPEFVIKRHTDADGWTTIQTMPTNLFSYTDTPPTTDGLTYIVTIETPETCTSTKSLAQDFNSSRSNKDVRFSTGGNTNNLQELLSGSMKMYPNPSGGEVSFENNAGVNVKVTVIDATARAVKQFELSGGVTRKDFSGLSDGLYQVIYEYEAIRVTDKLTIQH